MNRSPFGIEQTSHVATIPIADRAAALRVGDLAFFLLDDGTLEVETLNPLASRYAPVERVLWCYRVVAHEPCRGLLGRMTLLWRVRRHPERFAAKLGE